MAQSDSVKQGVAPTYAFVFRDARFIKLGVEIVDEGDILVELGQGGEPGRRLMRQQRCAGLRDPCFKLGDHVLIAGLARMSLLLPQGVNFRKERLFIGMGALSRVFRRGAGNGDLHKLCLIEQLHTGAGDVIKTSISLRRIADAIAQHKALIAFGRVHALVGEGGLGHGTGLADLFQIDAGAGAGPRQNESEFTHIASRRQDHVSGGQKPDAGDAHDAQPEIAGQPAPAKTAGRPAPEPLSGA